jgi:hypothetical protein
LKASIGDEVIKFMGGPGAPEVLFTTDRQTMAPTFYACALSFTKYVVSQIGLDETIKLIPQVPLEGVQTRIEELTRKPISTARAEWLRSIPLNCSKAFDGSTVVSDGCFLKRAPVDGSRVQQPVEGRRRPDKAKRVA